MNADVSDGRLPTRRRWARWVIGAIATLLLLAIGWVVVRGAGAVSELHNVDRSASQLRSAIATGDANRVQKIAPRIPQHAALAHDLTSDPIWRGFEIVPWLGPNFTAMREVAEIADRVSEDAVATVVDIAGEIDLANLGLNGSKIDLVPLPTVRDTLATADGALSAAEAEAQQIDADTTLPPLADAVQEMRGTISEYATIIGALHGASVLLPSMLGADGPRDYVVVMQNNADVRSHGGSADSLTLLRAENGVINIERQASAQDFPALKEPLTLADTTAALFEDRPGRNVRDITSIPDFSEAGAAIAARWEQKFGGTVDGVIAIDAVVAQHLVEATGPVAFGAYTVDDESVLPILLSTLYADTSDAAQQHAVLAQASKALFTAALESDEPQRIIGALANAADEGHIRIWSAHPDEEEFLAATNLGMTLPKDDERGAYVGVLFNNRTGGKMNFYTEAAISTAVGSCDGEPTTQVRVTWTNNAPVDAEQPLPASVTGSESEGMSLGDVRTLIAVYGPADATVRGAGSGSSDDVQNSTLGTRSIIQQEVLVAPGESTTITVSFVGGGAGERLAGVQHTPLIDAVKMTRGELICD